MRCPSFGSLRVRLIVLVLAIVAPLITLAIFHGIESGNTNRREAMNDVQRSAINASVLYSQILVETRQILATLSQISEFRRQDPDACSRIFAGILKQSNVYSGFAAAGADGTVFASSPLTITSVSFADRPWFQRLVQTRDFVVGEQVVGRVSGRRTVILGHPVLDDAGRLIAALCLGLDLDLLGQKLANMELPEGATLTVLDSDGTILHRLPDPERLAGKTIPDNGIVKTILARRQGTVEGTGRDGVPRLYGFTTLGKNLETIHISVDIPKEIVFAGFRQHMVRDLTLLGLVSALALWGAWLFGRKWILSPVNHLVEATKQLAEGNLTVRPGRTTDAGEFGVLASHFDRMAGALRCREEERTSAEEALRANETKYRLHFENVSDVIFSFDRELRILSISPSVERVLGYKPEEFIGRPFAELNVLSPEDLQRVLSGTKRAFAGERFDSVVYTFIARDGTRRYGECSSTPVLRGDEVVAVVTVARDITERKRAEAVLQLSEKKYYALTESITDLIYRAEPDTLAATYVNKAIERIFGYSVDEWLGDSSLWENTIHPEDRKRVFEAFQEAQSAALDGSVEYRIIRKDGESRRVVDRFAWEKDAGGRVVSLNGIVLDVTEHRQDELAQWRLREELFHVGRLAAAGEFAASVAHEIHQPLAAILNNAQAAQRILSSGRPAVDEVRDALQDIIDDDRRAVQVIRQLRLFLKRQEADKAILDIHAVIEEVLTILRYEILHRQVSLVLNPSPGIPLVEGHRIELQQVLMNLILNGCDALMNIDPRRRRICIRTFVDEPNRIVVAVEDSGTGLDKTEMDRVFEPYYSTKQEGLGVGLSLSKSVIEAHGGRIWAENNPEGGATFYFTLPAYKGNAVPS